MVRHTLKILQDFESVSDHFGTLWVNSFKEKSETIFTKFYMNSNT